MASQPIYPPYRTPPPLPQKWGLIENFLVSLNKHGTAIKPLFLKGGTLEGGRLTSHNSSKNNSLIGCVTSTTSSQATIETA